MTDSLFGRERAEIAPGAVHVPGYLDLDQQRRTTIRLVDVVTDLSTELEAHAPRSLVLIRARRLLKTLSFPDPSPELDALADELDAKGKPA